MDSFIIVPRTPRDTGVPPQLAQALVAKHWNENLRLRFWTDFQIGARKLKPDAKEVRELVLEGLELGGRLVTMLTVHHRWNGLYSFITPIAHTLYDLEAVKDRKHPELVWYAFRAFQAQYDLHEAFHAFDVPPMEFVHYHLHRSYEPLLQLTFLNLIDWRGDVGDRGEGW